MSLTSQVLLSVSLPSRKSVGASYVHQRDELRNQILHELEKNEFIATWILHDPRLQDARELTQQSDFSQEVSIFLDTARQADQRTVLSHQLADLIGRSRNLGVRITTLSTNSRIEQGNLNLLVRNKISMVNPHGGIQLQSLSVKSLEPRSLRYGVWEVPAPLQWAKQLSNPVRELILKSALRMRIKRPFQHIQIDLLSMLQNQIPAPKITGLLQSLNKLRDRGNIDITPIRSAATLLRHLHLKQPAHIPAA